MWPAQIGLRAEPLGPGLENQGPITDIPDPDPLGGPITDIPDPDPPGKIKFDYFFLFFGGRDQVGVGIR